MNWLNALNQLQREGTAAVLVTIAEHKGSTPRSTGSKMVVTATHSYDTIGGGHLEYKAIEHARAMLDSHQRDSVLHRFSLGASLGQCCGGAVGVLFEPVNPAALHLAIFGAGHVAKALLPVLSHLPVEIQWIDNRPEQFPAELPNNCERIDTEDPVAEVDAQPAGSAYLIMTHNHALDQALVQAVLARADARYLGMIGSQTKRKKFEHRLRHKGFDEAAITQLICPVGLPAIHGKLPGEIAVSIAAELITLYQQHAQQPADTSVGQVHRLNR